MVQLGGFLGRLLGPLLKNGFFLIKNVHISKNVLVPLRLTAAASVTDAVFEKKFFRYIVTALLTSNEKIDDIANC